MKTSVGLLKGDGIGPEISDSLVTVFAKLEVPIEWVPIACGEESLANEGSPMPDSAIEKIRSLGVAIKGPTGTPIGGGHRSANVSLRKALDLFANVRPCFKLAGVKTPFENVDLIIVRENTEDLYIGREEKISDDEAHSIKVITRKGSERVARFAFELAERLGRRRVTCVHKANIMKLSDGLFLSCFQKIAAEFPGIEADDMIVDNTCMQLVRFPEKFDVIVTENLYGDIISDLCAGLVGGLGLAGGANIGEKVAVFEAVHGTAPDIAGKGLANPTALLLSGIMMLKHLSYFEAASRLSKALDEVYAEAKSLTGDLGGKASTKEFTQALCAKL